MGVSGVFVFLEAQTLSAFRAGATQCGNTVVRASLPCPGQLLRASGFVVCLQHSPGAGFKRPSTSDCCRLLLSSEDVSSRGSVPTPCLQQRALSSPAALPAPSLMCQVQFGPTSPSGLPPARGRAVLRPHLHLLGEAGNGTRLEMLLQRAAAGSRTKPALLLLGMVCVAFQPYCVYELPRIWPRSSPEMFSGRITGEQGNLSNHVIDL